MPEEDERVLLARERTNLANERTFLSWVRTGLASVGGGLAIIRFLTFQTYLHQETAQVMGSLLVLLGIAMFFFSYLDFKHSFKKLKIANGCAGSLWFASLLSFVLITVSIGLFLIVFKCTGF